MQEADYSKSAKIGEIDRLLTKPGEIDRLLDHIDQDIIKSKARQKTRITNQPIKQRHHARSDRTNLLKIGSLSFLLGGVIATGHFYSQHSSASSEPAQLNNRESEASLQPTTPVIIEATDDCWISVRSASKSILYEDVLQEGQSLRLILPSGFEIYAGRPESLTVKINGTESSLSPQLRWHPFPGQEPQEHSRL